MEQMSVTNEQSSKHEGTKTKENVTKYVNENEQRTEENNANQVENSVIEKDSKKGNKSLVDLGNDEDKNGNFKRDKEIDAHAKDMSEMKDGFNETDICRGCASEVSL